MRGWLHRRLWNLCAHHGWNGLREWHQRTCPHPKWNTRVWGDIHCAWCGQTKRDPRVGAFFAPVLEAMEKDGYLVENGRIVGHRREAP